MNKTEIEGIFVSKKDINTANTVRMAARNYACNITYGNTIGDMFEYLETMSHGIIFFGEDYLSDYNLILELFTAKRLESYSIVFMDNSLNDIIDDCKSVNIYKSPDTKILDILNIIINKEKFYQKKLIEKLNLNKISVRITEYLTELGFSHKYVGFQYIKEAILIALDKNKIITSFNAEVYPIIAIKNMTKVNSVEKSIRLSIKTEFKKRSDLFKRFNMDPNKPVSNKEFLTCVIDEIRNEIIKNAENKE